MRANIKKLLLFNFLSFIFFILVSGVVPALAQRAGGGGTSARGGSSRIERSQPAKTAASPSPSPSPTPNPAILSLPTTLKSNKKQECDPAEVKGTCPGTYTFIYGFTGNRHPRGGGASSLGAGFAFITYFTKRLFLEVDNDNVTSVKDFQTKRQSGFGDTTLYLGADIFLESKRRPLITVQYGVKIPTASAAKGLGTGKIDHKITGAFSKNFGGEIADGIKREYFEFDVGNLFAGRANSGKFDNLPFAAAIFKHKLNERNTFHFELGGNFRTGTYAGDAYNLDYLETKLTKCADDCVSLRVGGRFGITSNSPQAGLYLALKFEGNLKRVFR